MGELVDIVELTNVGASGLQFTVLVSDSERRGCVLSTSVTLSQTSNVLCKYYVDRKQLSCGTGLMNNAALISVGLSEACAFLKST